jgi:hypothetical protein
MHAAVEIAARSSRIDAPPNMLSMQSSNIGLLQGMNGGMIKSEAGYSGTSPYMFGADGNVLEARPSIADASVASFSSVESSSQALNESILDADISSFGFLSQIPRNFSLSDLTADFTQSSGLSPYHPALFSPSLYLPAPDFLSSTLLSHKIAILSVCWSTEKLGNMLFSGLNYNLFR